MQNICTFSSQILSILHCIFRKIPLNQSLSFFNTPARFERKILHLEKATAKSSTCCNCRERNQSNLHKGIMCHLSKHTNKMPHGHLSTIKDLNSFDAFPFTKLLPLLLTVCMAEALYFENKTPARAFTPPAEKKTGKKWTFMYNCTGRGKHEEANFLNNYYNFKIFHVIGARTRDLARKFLLKSVVLELISNEIILG